MDTETEERYVSMRLAHGDITNAIDLLNRARKESDNSIRSTIVRYCIIVYAKPFKISRGIFRAKFIPLKEEVVFPGGNTDHKALMDERDKRIAHGDITSFCPKLHYWSRPDIFPIVFKSSHLYDNIDKLIDKMLVLCNTVLRYLTDEMKTLETLFREQIKNTPNEWVQPIADKSGSG
jgi:hypothetical protein